MRVGSDGDEAKKAKTDRIAEIEADIAGIEREFTQP